MNRPLLDIRSVSKSYRVDHGRRQALKSVSLQVNRGRHLGIIGRSGSGKSTLARLVLGLESPDEGTLLLEEKPLSAYRNRLPTLVQIIFQDPAVYLNPYFTVFRLISEPLQLFHSDLSPRRRQVRVSQLLEQVGLNEELIHRKPHQLSGGQCQRVAIARALALNPRLLVCDEPFTNIDVFGQAGMVRLFERLTRQYDLTCILIAHDLSLVERFCRDIAVLQNGRLIEHGDTGDFIRFPRTSYGRALKSHTLRWFERSDQDGKAD